MTTSEIAKKLESILTDIDSINGELGLSFVSHLQIRSIKTLLRCILNDLIGREKRLAWLEENGND